MKRYFKKNSYALLSIFFGLLPFMILRLLTIFNYPPLPFLFKSAIGVLVWISVPIQLILLIIAYKKGSNPLLLVLSTLIFICWVIVIYLFVSTPFLGV
ncbi:hypothetical protein J2R98_001870 [Alkalibacillus filiformis]|uniref:Uncharacterized protein n=1 Tax=Alkalibacillus filiformis TaxID=200990 RepID=A0ABU0DUC7_9BACI|nr:hypothetical protein [Alkalibacillus filiformis]